MERARLDEVIYRVIGCMIEVHKQLRPGFVEKIYQRALEVELACCGIPFESEKEIDIYYRGKHVGKHRLDLLIAGEIIVELKTVEMLVAKHYSQVRSYLKATGHSVALLVNFFEPQLDCRRVEPKAP